jgi:hypothetical protein
MNSADVALLITAIGGSCAAIITAIAALRNSNSNAAKAETSEERIKKLEDDLADELKRRETDRRNIIVIGEELSNTRYDASALAMLVNQLFNQFKAATGTAPEVDIEMLRHLRTIGYITGQLGPLDVEAVKAQK